LHHFLLSLAGLLPEVTKIETQQIKKPTGTIWRVLMTALIEATSSVSTQALKISVATQS
jgi:hypothetical protein